MKIEAFFKYDKGQEVVVKETNKKGTIKRREFIIHDNKEKTTIMEKYNVDMGGHLSTTYSVDDIQPVEEFYKLEYPEQVHDVLIDVQLKKKDYDFVKRLHNERNNNQEGIR